MYKQMGHGDAVLWQSAPNPSLYSSPLTAVPSCGCLHNFSHPRQKTIDSGRVTANTRLPDRNRLPPPMRWWGTQRSRKDPRPRGLPRRPHRPGTCEHAPHPSALLGLWDSAEESRDTVLTAKTVGGGDQGQQKQHASALRTRGFAHRAPLGTARRRQESQRRWPNATRKCELTKARALGLARTLAQLGRDALEGGEAPPPPPSRAPSLRPPTVPLTPRASLYGICNRH